MSSQPFSPSTLSRPIGHAGPAVAQPVYRRLLLLGMGPSVAIIMAGSTAMSLLITSLAIASFGSWSEAWRMTLALATLIPLICSGIVGTVMMRMLYQLDEARREVQRLAITDGLTGLFNRRHFMEIAEREFARSQRYGAPLTIAMLDADHFKRVNDQHGHATGDEVLRQIARACARSVRSVDALARYGGEEFVVLMPMADDRAARAVAERIRNNVSALRILDGEGRELRITVSMGLAGLGPRSGSLGDLLNRADEALYRAKAAGRDRVEVTFDGTTEQPGDAAGE